MDGTLDSASVDSFVPPVDSRSVRLERNLAAVESEVVGSTLAHFLAAVGVLRIVLEMPWELVTWRIDCLEYCQVWRIDWEV